MGLGLVLAGAVAVRAVAGRQSDPAVSPRRHRQAVGREEAGRLTTTTPVGPVDLEAAAEQSGAREGEEEEAMARVPDRTDAWRCMA